MAKTVRDMNQFTVFMSNNMESLADLCALLMSEYPLSDPFAHEKVVVMNLGMNKFLSQRIATQNSIAAMCDYKQVWQLIYETYRIIHPDAPRKDLYDRRHITWNIYSMIENWNKDSIVVQARKKALESCDLEFNANLNESLKRLADDADKVYGAGAGISREALGLSGDDYSSDTDPLKSGGDIYDRLRLYLSDDRYGDKAYELSAKIADTLDQYQMYRPEWIMEWNKIPLSAFDDYELYPDDDSNPINVFIESQCQRFIREKTGLNAAKRKAEYEEAVKSGEDEDIRHTFEEVSSEHVTSARTEMVRHLFKSNVWQIKLWCSLRYNLSLDPDISAGSFTDEPEVRYRFLTHLDRSQIMVSLINELKNSKKLPHIYERVFVFGVSALPRVVIDFLDALSRHCSVNVMLLNPCQEYWADIAPRHRQDFERYTDLIRASTKSAKEAKLDRKGKFLPVRGAVLSLNDFDDSGERIEGNPLLLSYGKQGRDNLYLLFDRDPMPQSISCFSEPDVQSEFVTEEIVRNNMKVNETKGGSLLAYIQRQLLFLEQPEDRYVIGKDDVSFSIHACHTQRREVEVLHDAILECFNRAKQREKEDPSYKLYPRDIVVMVPAINEYAPHIEAVFGGAHKYGDPDYIPYVISDQTERETNTVTEALLKLLEIGNKRITASLVLDLLSEGAIAKRFNLNQEQVDVIKGWISKTNIYWGLNENDVSEYSEIALPGTFESGMDRMLLGTMLGESFTMPGYSDIEGADALILGRFWDFVNALKELRHFFKPELALEPVMWSAEINRRLTQRFFDSSDETVMALRSVETVIEELKDTINALERKPSINLPVFAATLRQGLSAQTNFMPFLREKINFCSLVPMRAVPFKHVFILGLNDTDFPREERMPGFNLMSSHELFERGDRSRGTDDRFLFLEAILSARESVYFSYIGRSPTDKAELNPSIVLNELMYYVYERCSIEGLEDLSESKRQDSVRERIVYEEHLNAYSEHNYIASGASFKDKQNDKALLYPYKLPSFNTDFIAISGSPKKNREFVGKDLFIPLADEDKVRVVTLDDVFFSIINPSRYFALKNLGVNVNRSIDEEQTKDDEDFTLQSFEFKGHITELLSVPPEEREAILEAYSISGKLPSGVFKNLVVDTIKEKVDLLTECMREKLGIDNTGIETVACPNAIYRLIIPNSVCNGEESPDLVALTEMNLAYAQSNGAAAAALGIDQDTKGQQLALEAQGEGLVLGTDVADSSQSVVGNSKERSGVPAGCTLVEITLQASRKLKPIVFDFFSKASSDIKQETKYLSDGTEWSVPKLSSSVPMYGVYMLKEQIAQYLGGVSSPVVTLLNAEGNEIKLNPISNDDLRYVITFILLCHVLAKMRVIPIGKQILKRLLHDSDGELIAKDSVDFDYDNSSTLLLGSLETIINSPALAKMSSDFIDLYLTKVASNLN